MRFLTSSALLTEEPLGFARGLSPAFPAPHLEKGTAPLRSYAHCVTTLMLRGHGDPVDDDVDDADKDRDDYNDNDDGEDIDADDADDVEI